MKPIGEWEMIDQNSLDLKGALGEAIKKLIEEIRDGLRHGFFHCEVNCEIVKGGKRRLTIKAGKSHQFIIREEELTD
jgi:hypothetical protein